MKDEVMYSPKSAWTLYRDEARKKAVFDFAERYRQFLGRCKTERETVLYVAEALREHGFSEDPAAPKTFRVLRDKAVFAARKGDRPLAEGLSLIAAHADSPRLDFKQRPLIEQADVAQAKTHYYGGIRKYQWLSRPLALHGVIVRENGERIAVRVGEQPGEPVFCVADLLPHLAQKQNEQTVKEAFEGEKLNVILGHTPAAAEEEKDESKEPVKRALLEFLHSEYGICEEDLITAELEVVPAGPAQYVGFDRGLIGAYGHDDRICVFTALEAFLESGDEGPAKALVFWDKEEIGSDGATGASSRFLQYCVEDLARAWEPETPASHVLLASRALSSDVTAAIGPDFQDLHEKQNSARLGYGPCFCKFTGSRGKYGASEADAEFFASLRGLFNANRIPWQVAELGKVDTGGGGTVALFLAAWGMRVIDLGPALLAMHSPFELASCADVYATKEAYRLFLSWADEPVSTRRAGL